MKIAPIQFNYSNRNVKFGEDCDNDYDCYTPCTRLQRYAAPLSHSETHPIWVGIDFHENGKVSNIKIDYQNGDFASGIITESYDENGKNINYQV